jgi:hypothetical protein
VIENGNWKIEKRKRKDNAEYAEDTQRRATQGPGKKTVTWGTRWELENGN